jgi:hypothetical protein
MLPSRNPSLLWQICSPAGRFFVAVGSAVFVDPFAVIAALMSGWLLILIAPALVQPPLGSAGLSAIGTLAHAACVLALGLITALAAGHVALTAAAGWSARRESQP